jgi:putative ABC transport system substrate-binding protein
MNDHDQQDSIMKRDHNTRRRAARTLGGLLLAAALILAALVDYSAAAFSMEQAASSQDNPAAPMLSAPIKDGLPATELQDPWRLGVLFWHDSPNDTAALKGIREGLEETGQPHELLLKQADESRDKALSILETFEQEGVDLVFAMGTQAALIAAETVKEIPVVFTAVTNPVESGVVLSWKGSGSNLAGNSNWIDSETKLRVFRLAVTGLARLGVLRSQKQDVITAAELRDMRGYLRRPDTPRIVIFEEVVEKIEDIESAVERLVENRVQAVWIPIDKLIYENMGVALQAVQPHGIPLVSTSLKGARAGAAASVVVDYVMLGKRAVLIAIEILEEGADPGEIPVGTMNGYHVIVNLEAARRCGFEPPLTLLVLADSILEDVAAPKESENGGNSQDK